MDYSFQCVVSSFYHAGHMLIFRVLHGREILNLVLYLGVFQVLLDVLRLGKLESLQVFCLSLRWLLGLVVLVRFFSLQGRDVKIFRCYSDIKIHGLVCFFSV